MKEHVNKTLRGCFPVRCSAGRPERCRGARRKAWSGFTLVELLVVVAILGVLTGLLLPAVRAARAKANTSTCLTHLRQLGSAIQLYAGDHDDYLPPVANYTGTLPGGTQRLHWIQYISGYVNLENDSWWEPFSPNNIFWGCPAWRGRDNNWNVPAVGDAAWSSPGYGMNAYLKQPDWTSTAEPDEVIRLSSVTHASKRALLCDAIDWHVAGAWNYDNGYYGFATWSPGDPRRHGDVANYLFCDLHAGSLHHTEAHLYLYDPAAAGK